MPSFKERERQRREHEIRCAAGRLIAERGYAALTMDDLADAVGISKPTLYQHFKSKEDLVTQVIAQALDAFVEYLHASALGAPIDRLRSALRFLLEHHNTPDSALASLGPELVMSTVKSSAALAERKARIWTLLCALVEDGKAQGQIDAATPTPVIVRTLFCLLSVMSHQVEVDLNDTVDGVLRLFFYGITPR